MFQLRYICRSVIIALFIFIPYYAYAGDSIKIGFIDLNEIAERSNLAKIMKDEFKNEGLKKQTEIDELKRKVEQLGEELEKQSLLLTDEKRKEKEEKYKNEKRKLERLFSDSSEEFENKKAEAEQKLLEKIMKKTKELGVQEGFTVILSKQLLLFASEGIDLTDRIIKKVDEDKSR